MEKQDVFVDVCNAQTMDGETEKIEMLSTAKVASYFSIARI